MSESFSDETPQVELRCLDCAGTEYERITYTVNLDEVMWGGDLIHPDVPDGEGHDDYEVVSTENLPAAVTDYEAVCRWSEAFDDVGADYWEAYCLYITEEVGSVNNPQNSRTFVDEVYRGCYESIEAFGQTILDEYIGHEISEHLSRYIDMEMFTRDYTLDYGIVDSGHGVFVYNNL